MKVLYITQTFPPEPGATQRPLKQAVCLQKLGCKLTILTTMPNYPLGQIFKGYRGKLLVREKVDGISVIRIWSIPASNKGKILRIISYISFAIAASMSGIFICPHDLVISSVPNIGTEIAGVIISRFKKSKLLLELRDIIPDNLTFIGIPKNSLLANVLFAYFQLIYKRVDLIAVPGENMVAVLEQRGVSPNCILLWPHAADSEQLTAGGGWQVRQRFNLHNKFIVLYAGSFSRYYDVPNMVAAALLLRERLPQVHLMLLGTGPTWDEVDHTIKKNFLNNVTVVGPVAPKKVYPYLQAADLFIHSYVCEPIPKYIQDSLTTKISEYLLIGRPVIAVESGPVCGNLLERIGAGFSVPAYQPEALADGIVFFATNQAETIRCGNRAKQYARTNLERKKIVEKFYFELVQKLSDL